MEYTQTIDPTDFWSWKKIEAGHYVLTTDNRYTATVQKAEYGTAWVASATSPSGRVRSDDGIRKVYGHDNMADARKQALRQIDNLIQEDETELIVNSLRSGTYRPTSKATLKGTGYHGGGEFTIEGEHHTYKVTVERCSR